MASITLPADPVTGKRRRKMVRRATKSAALAAVRELRAEVEAAGASSDMSLADWLERWMDIDVRDRLKPASTAGYESAIRLYIGPLLGRKRLADLTADDVRALDREVARRSSAASASRVHRTLARALNVAMREDLLTRNVASLVTPPRHRAADQHIPTTDEARRLIEACRQTPEYARRMTSLFLGARQGEVLGMTLENLHLDGEPPSVELAWEVRRVTWAHGCERDGEGWTCGYKRGADCPARRAPVPEWMEGEAVHGGLWILRPKTHGSWRHVALPSPLVEALREHIAATKPRRFVFEEEPGVPVDPSNDARQWRATLKRAGLPPMRLHAARSAVATALMEDGIPQRTIMEILGHTQIATTQHYQRPTLAYQAEALERLAEAIMPASANSSPTAANRRASGGKR